MEDKSQINKETQNNYVPELMQKAIDMAKKSYENYEVAVGCVFAEVDDKKQYEIIAQEHNLTNETQNSGSHLTLYVTCEPCIMCAYALGIFGIKEVFYGCKNDKFGGNGSILDIDKGIYGSIPYNSYGGYREQECADVLKQFYERGNLNLEEELRHRKKKIKKETEQQEEK